MTTDPSIASQFDEAAIRTPDCVAECLRLASKPPGDTRRGMTLWDATPQLDNVMKLCIQIDRIIDAQKILLERSERLFNAPTVAREKTTLAALIDIRDAGLSPKLRMLAVMALLVNFDSPKPVEVPRKRAP